MNKKRYTAEEAAIRKKESVKRYQSKPEVKARMREYNKLYMAIYKRWQKQQTPTVSKHETSIESQPQNWRTFLPMSTSINSSTLTE